MQPTPLRACEIEALAWATLGAPDDDASPTPPRRRRRIGPALRAAWPADGFVFLCRSWVARFAG